MLLSTVAGGPVWCSGWKTIMHAKRKRDGSSSWSEIRSQTWYEIRSQTWYEIRSQTWSEIRSQIWSGDPVPDLVEIRSQI